MRRRRKYNKSEKEKHLKNDRKVWTVSQENQESHVLQAKGGVLRME